MNDPIRAAKAFAIEAHQGQGRKYVGGPYIEHVADVAELVERTRLSSAAEAAAWLNDVVEDCEVTISQIDEEFGSYVGVLVRDLTNFPESSGPSKEERKAMDIERLRFAAPEAQSIKCANIISNVSTVSDRAPMFAKSYVPERRKVLDVLKHALPALRHQAEAVVRQAETATSASR